MTFPIRHGEAVTRAGTRCNRAPSTALSRRGGHYSRQGAAVRPIGGTSRLGWTGDHGRRDAGGLAAKTVRDIHGGLHAALRDVARWGHVARNVDPEQARGGDARSSWSEGCASGGIRTPTGCPTGT